MSVGVACVLVFLCGVALWLELVLIVLTWRRPARGLPISLAVAGVGWLLPARGWIVWPKMFVLMFGGVLLAMGPYALLYRFMTRTARAPRRGSTS